MKLVLVKAGNGEKRFLQELTFMSLITLRLKICLLDRLRNAMKTLFFKMGIKNIICSEKDIFRVEYIIPYLFCFFMVGIVSVKQGKKCRCINKNSHLPNASTRYVSCFLEMSRLPELNLPTMSIALFRLSSMSTIVLVRITVSTACLMSSAIDRCRDNAIFFNAFTCSSVN